MPPEDNGFPPAAFFYLEISFPYIYSTYPTGSFLQPKGPRPKTYEVSTGTIPEVRTKHALGNILYRYPREQLIIYVIIGQLQAAPCMCFCFQVGDGKQVNSKMETQNTPRLFYP